MSDLIAEERIKILRGLEEAYKRLVKFKKLNKSPMVVSSNGRIVKLQPDQLRLTTRYRGDKHNS